MSAYIDSSVLKVSLMNPIAQIVLQHTLIPDQEYILVFSQDFSSMQGYAALYELSSYSKIKFILKQAMFRINGDYSPVKK